MFRKITNKTLLILFAVLATMAVIMIVYDNHRGERTFKKELFSVDSAAVSSITIYPKGKGKDPLKLSKTSSGWEVLSQKKHFPADSSIIRNILQSLSHITPERVSGTDKSSWKSFEITDSAGTRVVVEQGTRVVADFRTGKISFSQDRNSQNYGGNRGMSVKSHIRVEGDERVYVVDGFLSMMFSDNPSQYRNRLVFKFDKNLVTKLTFVYPGDSSFVLAKNGTKWTINDQPADSAATTSYLGSIANTMGSEFADEGAIFPVYRYSLKIEGNNLRPIEVNGAMDEGSKKYYVRSNANLTAIFGSSTPSLFNQIFAAKKRFTH
ncbi:MAG: DUF4340 domain-containing protein [Bacteroidota bacterium]